MLPLTKLQWRYGPKKVETQLEFGAGAVDGRISVDLLWSQCFPHFVSEYCILSGSGHNIFSR